MKKIELTQGRLAFVSDEDYDRVSAYKWHFQKDKGSLVKGYACRMYSRDDGKRRLLFLHKFIINATAGTIVDHKNGDTLDCRRENLRFASASQNKRNCRLSINNTTGFKGVFLRKKGNTFYAQIELNGRGKHLGNFQTAIEAAYAYDEAARQYYGEFAALNFPREGERGCHRKRLMLPIPQASPRKAPHAPRLPTAPKAP